MQKKCAKLQEEEKKKEEEIERRKRILEFNQTVTSLRKSMKVQKKPKKQPQGKENKRQPMPV